MRRRTYLTTAVLAALGGCTSSVTGGGGPEYDSDDKETLLLTVDELPFDGWERDDSINDDFDQGFISEDEDEIVLASAAVHDEVSGAEDKFSEVQDGYAETNDYDIGDEAFWATRNEQVAYVYFRHSNAIGSVAGVKQSGGQAQPAQTNAQQAAQAMFDGWSEV